MLIILVALFGLGAAIIAIGASHKLENQRQAHDKKLTELADVAERAITEHAEKLAIRGFKEGFKQAEIAYGLTSKPRGKKRKANA